MACAVKGSAWERGQFGARPDGHDSHEEGYLELSGTKLRTLVIEPAVVGLCRSSCHYPLANSVPHARLFDRIAYILFRSLVT
jgi:hypothetical protein